jgi:hypothetical protein
MFIEDKENCIIGQSSVVVEIVKVDVIILQVRLDFKKRALPLMFFLRAHRHVAAERVW